MHFSTPNFRIEASRLCIYRGSSL